MHDPGKIVADVAAALALGGLPASSGNKVGAVSAAAVSRACVSVLVGMTAGIRPRLPGQNLPDLVDGVRAAPAQPYMPSW